MKPNFVECLRALNTFVERILNLTLHKLPCGKYTLHNQKLLTPFT